MSEEKTLDNENVDPSPEAQAQPEETPRSDVETKDEEQEDRVDYAKIVEEDIKTLREEFSELSELNDICELDNPLRYAALRDLGLTPAEAYLATARRQKKDNRSHLTAMRTVSVSSRGAMTDSEMAMARDIFGDISDAEIRKLYKKVTR